MHWATVRKGCSMKGMEDVQEKREPPNTCKGRCFTCILLMCIFLEHLQPVALAPSNISEHLITISKPGYARQEKAMDSVQSGTPHDKSLTLPANLDICLFVDVLQCLQKGGLQTILLFSDVLPDLVHEHLAIKRRMIKFWLKRM
eukprot:1150573-Pelagomonas_calceolata.AAC.3